MTREIRTTCNRDCPDSCGIVATVENGRIVGHRGDAEHGITQGFLCYRGNHYLKRFYSKDRILHPMRKGSKGFYRVSWEEALDVAAKRLASYRDKEGPLSVAYISYSGIKGLVARLLGRKFWAHFGGVTSLKGGTSVEAAHAGQALDFGGPCTHAPEDLVNSAAIVVFGKNVAVTRVHSWPFIREARKRGAQLAVIDPVRSATARNADRHYAIRPGSDGALAMGIARVLMEQGRIDEAFIRNHTHGFEAYRERILSTTLKEAARAADLEPKQIEELAELYASAKPLATLIGLGPSYWENGGAMVRLIDALAAITGNIGIPGGGVHTDIHGGAGLDFSLFDDLPEAPSRRLLLPALGREIAAAKNPPIRMAFVAGANPAATCPDTAKVRESLGSLEFVLVVDQFMTATAEMADLFLPCTTYLEMEDLVIAYGHHWIGLNQEVVPPLGEARSDRWILQELAKRLGFGPALSGEPGYWIDRLLAPLNAHGITREKLMERPMADPLAEAVPFADRKFATPSGRFEFINELSRPESEGEDGRLCLMATKTLKMVNAQINDEDLPDEPVVRLHPHTLAARGLEDGESVVVESPAGRVRVRIAVDPFVRPDVLFFNPAAWRGDLQGVNQLREARLCDMGDGAAMHQTRVTVKKA